MPTPAERSYRRRGIPCRSGANGITKSTVSLGDTALCTVKLSAWKKASSPVAGGKDGGSPTEGWAEGTEPREVWRLSTAASDIYDPSDAEKTSPSMGFAPTTEGGASEHKHLLHYTLFFRICQQAFAGFFRFMKSHENSTGFSRGDGQTALFPGEFGTTGSTIRIPRVPHR